MQIQLKQADIEQAIKNHIAAIGIQREVDEIHFTMGRKSSGLVADINVSDRVNVPSGPIKRTTVDDQTTAEEYAAVPEEAVDVSVEPTEEEEATTSSEKSSLFGS